MSELISKDAALDCFHDWIDRYGNEHTADEDATYQRVEALEGVGSCEDAISRQMAIDTIMGQPPEPHYPTWYAAQIEKLPAAQPDHIAESGKKVEQTGETAQNAQNEDLISRKWLVECIEEGWVKFDTAKDCNRMMHLVRDIAPSVQPEQNAQDEDLISREAAIEALARMMPRSYTPGGSHPADEEIFRAQEIFADCIEALEILTPAQPEQHWIPVTERLPENDNEVLITVWDAEDDYVEVYKGFYQGHEWWTQWCHGCSKIKDEPCGENIVIAWMPLPEPYRGGDE